MSRNSIKTYTEASHPNHKLIKALKEKGHTNITITKYDALTRPYCYVFSSDQVDHRQLSGNIDFSLVLIQKWPAV